MKILSDTAGLAWRSIARSAVISTLLMIPAVEVVAQDATSSRTSVIPFPFFFYTPETDVAFGATIIGYKTLTGTDRASSQPRQLPPALPEVLPPATRAAYA